MSTLDFIAAFTSALAWPFASIALGLMFRSPLTDLLRNARKVKGFGIEFERGLSEVQEDAASVLPQIAPPTSTVPPQPTDSVLAFREQALAVAEISPNAAVSLAWSGIERSLRSLVERFLPGEPSLLTSFAAGQIAKLHAAGVFGTDVTGILNKMRGLRNKAAHPTLEGADVSREEASGYVDLAASMIDYLDSITTLPTLAA